MTQAQIEEARSELILELGLCGCGPDAALQYVRDVLCLCDAEGDHWAQLDDFLHARDDVRGYFVLCALTQADWIEHGGTIFCSWRTPRGDEVLKQLIEVCG